MLYFYQNIGGEGLRLTPYIVKDAHIGLWLNNMKQITVLDSSRISTWLQCQRRFQLSHVENLTTIGEKPAFAVGHFIHAILEAYYKAKMAGESHDYCTRIAMAYGKKFQFENKENLPEEQFKSLIQRFLAYTVFYEKQHWTVKGVEVGFSVPIFETDKRAFILEGRIDLILADAEGRLYFCDHKTQSREYDIYQFSPQILNYALALGTKYGLINYFGLQQSGDASKWFRQQVFHFSQQQLNEWRMDLISIFFDVEAKAAQGFYRKNRSACKNGLNQICDFAHICAQSSPEFANEIKRLEFRMREPWTPWKLEK